MEGQGVRPAALGGLGDPSCGPEFRLDPLVRERQSFSERHLGLPTQNLTESGVVAVPAPYPLRLGEVCRLVMRFRRYRTVSTNWLTVTIHRFPG